MRNPNNYFVDMSEETVHKSSLCSDPSIQRRSNMGPSPRPSEASVVSFSKTSSITMNSPETIQMILTSWAK